MVEISSADHDAASRYWLSYEPVHLDLVVSTFIILVGYYLLYNIISETTYLESGWLIMIDGELLDTQMSMSIFALFLVAASTIGYIYQPFNEEFILYYRRID